MSKCKYVALDSYMIRKSYYPFSKYTELLEQVSNENLDEVLVRLCQNAEFREALLIASESLYLDMNRYMAGEILSESKKNEIRLSIIKYWIRMSTRETPFGMFAVVGMGNIHKDKISLDRKIKKGIKPDLEWLYGVIKNMEKHYSTNLLYSFNKAIYVKNENIIEMPYVTGHPVQKETINVSIYILHILKDYGKKVFSIQEIFNYVKNMDYKISKEEFDKEIKTLIEKELLISNLRPPMTDLDILEYVLNQLKILRIRDELVEQLCKINAKMKLYKTLLPGEGEYILKSLISDMRELYETSKFLQVDMMNMEEENVLTIEDVSEITEFINTFMTIWDCFYDSFSIYDEYKDLFYNKYGDYREISLLEMLDINKGIGVPDHYIEAKKKKRGRKKYPIKVDTELMKIFLNKFEHAVKYGNPIKLDDIDCVLNRESQSDRRNRYFPNGIDICIRKEIEDDEIVYVCNSNIGYIGTGRIAGRFSYLDNSITEHIYNTVNAEKQKHNEEIIFCDLLYVPPRLRMGNVAMNPSLCNAELVLYTNSNNTGAIQITLDDILVGIHNGRFYLKSKSLNRQIQIHIGNVLYYYKDCAAIRFLKEIQMDGMVRWEDNLFDKLNTFIHFPEIRYKSIVLRPECWNITCENKDVLNNFGVFEEWFATIVKKEQIHRMVDLVEGDNRLLLDLQCRQHRMILFQTFRQYQSARLLRNNYRKKSRAATEVILSMINQNTDKQLIEPSKYDRNNCLERRKGIGDEWLYFKVYGISDENQFIYNNLNSFIKTLEGIEGYYYVRYADPYSHIRIRIKGKEVFNNLEFLISWMEVLIKNGIIMNYELSPYERELERYGGVNGMIAAENLFMADSKITAELLEMLNNSKDKYDLEFICVISFLFYFVQFGWTMEKAFEWLNTMYDQSSFRKEFNECSKYYYENLYYDKFTKKSMNREILRLFGERSKMVYEYVQVLKSLENPLFEYDILKSVLHMNFNRLLGMNGNLERKLLSFTRHTIYTITQKKRHIKDFDEKLLWNNLDIKEMYDESTIWK